MSKHTSIPPWSRLGLSRIEAAEYVGVSPTKFDDMVRDQRMPNGMRIDGRVVWPRKGVEAAFEKLQGDEQRPAARPAEAQRGQL